MRSGGTNRRSRCRPTGIVIGRLCVQEDEVLAELIRTSLIRGAWSGQIDVRAEGRRALEEPAQLGIVRRRRLQNFFEAGVLFVVHEEEALVGKTSLRFQCCSGENEIADATGILVRRSTNECILFFGEAQVQALCLRGAHWSLSFFCTEFIRTSA